MKIPKLLSSIFSSNRPPKKVLDVIQKITSIAFPRGQEQINEEAELVYALLNKKVPIADAKRILIRTKPSYYFDNHNRKSNEIEKNSEVLRNSTKIPLLDTDLDLIYKFYENYFGFKDELFKEEFCDSDTQVTEVIHCNDVDMTIALLDQNKTYWGTIEFKGEETQFIARSGESGGMCSALLFLAVASARQKLSQKDRDEFARWAALPQGRWTEIHYSEFAFSCVNWLSTTGDEIGDNKTMVKAKELLSICHEFIPLDVDFSHDIRALIFKTFGIN